MPRHVMRASLDGNPMFQSGCSRSAGRILVAASVMAPFSMFGDMGTGDAHAGPVGISFCAARSCG
eukprot:4873782-Pyramimonas_sp.AAC.1